MKPWTILARARTPDGGDLTLTEHVSEFAILLNGQSLMSSRMHHSEDALAIIGCRLAKSVAAPRVLVGGLGMGFTLRAALDALPATAEVVVSELVHDVVEWNRGPIGAVANHPLADPRVTVDERDVAETLKLNRGGFDAVLLDVDNSPAAFTVSSNSAIYGDRGLVVARRALRPAGVLAIWSAKDDVRFEGRLKSVGFKVERERVASRAKRGGFKHTIIVAHKIGA